MKKTMILTLTAATMLFASSPAPQMGMQHGKAMGKKMMKKESPFLINGKMPHLTKLVMMNWDKLNLTKEQQEALKKIRQETMSSVKSLKPTILKLENEVAKATMQGADPATLKAKVDEIAKYKAEATMAHIKCIHDTKKVLTQEQLKQLLP
jgi:Spy/CpxP family protein refolding chaperone